MQLPDSPRFAQSYLHLSVYSFKSCALEEVSEAMDDATNNLPNYYPFWSKNSNGQTLKKKKNNEVT